LRSVGAFLVQKRIAFNINLWYNLDTEREVNKMKFTYKQYLFKNELEQFKNDIEIIEEEKMDLGSVVTFHCEDEKVLDKIFQE
jgi:hypothetical protein